MRTLPRPSGGKNAEAGVIAFSDGSGRANLRYGEPAGVGRTVSVWVDNYTEQADGTKAVGPTWKAAGVTPSHIHAAIADSGLAP